MKGRKQLWRYVVLLALFASNLALIGCEENFPIAGEGITAHGVESNGSTLGTVQGTLGSAYLSN